MATTSPKLHDPIPRCTKCDGEVGRGVFSKRTKTWVHIQECFGKRRR